MTAPRHPDRARVSPARVHAHRMEMVGRLVVWFARQPDTPARFGGDSISFRSLAFGEILPALAGSERLIESSRDETATLARYRSPESSGREHQG